MVDAATPIEATHATEAGNGIPSRYGIIGPVDAARRAGRYTLGAKLGSGGSADVFEARADDASGLSKPLVVKRIRPELLGEPQAASLLRKEAEVARGLQHGNIAAVLDYGEDDGAPYIVMERVDGCSLRTLLCHLESRGHTLPLADAASIAEQVADALHYMHRFETPSHPGGGLVHRDVKPENILLSRRGVVKLTDFGLTKPRTLPTETAPGFVKGTPRYLAPEQAAGRPLDGRADIYALGIVFGELCEAADGERPTAILERATELSPQARYRTALEFRTALERWRVEQGLCPDPQRLAVLVDRAAAPRHKRVVSLDAALGALPTEPSPARSLATASPPPSRVAALSVAAAAILLLAAGVALWPDPPVRVEPPASATPAPPLSEAAPLELDPPPSVPPPPPEQRPAAEDDEPTRSPAPAKRGSVRINVLPYATVRIDGKDYGQTPTTTTLPVGKHHVVLENPQTGKRVEGTVVVSASKTTSIKTWDALQ